MPAFRILAVSGFTALSATTYYYYHKLNGENNAAANCEPFRYYDGGGHSPQFECKPWYNNWDFRHPNTIIEHSNETLDSKTDADATGKPTATRHVILLRHGQYFHDERGDHLRMLTELGRQQAAVTGERLKSLDIKFDRLVISTMTRAQETGKIIAEFLPGVEQTHCSLLREGRPFHPEPSRPHHVKMGWQQQLFADHPRIEGAFRKYIHRADPEQKEDSYDLLVCHANVIRYFVCKALQFPPEGWLRMSIAHCGITWISIRPNGRVSIRGMGHSGHLPPDFVTFNNPGMPVLVT